MDANDASKLCESHGAALLHYTWPRVAKLVMRSREHILISIGIKTAKIFRPTPVLGWLFPTCCVSKPLAEWDARFREFRGVQRVAARGMVLDGLLDLVSRADSVAELCLAWCVIRNPMEIASIALFKETFPDIQLPGDATKT